MDRDDLALGVERHATSKLQDDDLSRIFTLGFRGEALPSIGAVARLSIRSRANGADQTYEIAVNGGTKAPLKPAAMGEGTRIEVRDLVYATPARLRFMKSERVVIADVLKRLALAKPEVAFSLATGDRTALRFEPPGLLEHGLARLGQHPRRGVRCRCIASVRRAWRRRGGRLRRPADVAPAERPCQISRGEQQTGARQLLAGAVRAAATSCPTAPSDARAVPDASAP